MKPMFGRCVLCKKLMMFHFKPCGENEDVGL